MSVAKLADRVSLNSPHGQLSTPNAIYIVSHHCGFTSHCFQKLKLSPPNFLLWPTVTSLFIGFYSNFRLQSKQFQHQARKFRSWINASSLGLQELQVGWLVLLPIWWTYECRMIWNFRQKLEESKFMFILGHYLNTSFPHVTFERFMSIF